MELKLVYCAVWDYEPEAVSLAAAVLPHFKHRIASLVLVPSEDGRFEVSVDGKLIYSKLETGRFPEHDAIIRQIEAVLR